MAKRKVQRVKQRSTKHTYKTKDRVTRTPLKPGKCLQYWSNSKARQKKRTAKTLACSVKVALTAACN